MSQFQHRDHQLVINGVAIQQLAHRVGQTPFYAYDRSVIAHNIETLRHHFGKLAHLHYAIKANPMPALVDFISPLVDGLDVASGRELTLALNSGMSVNNISFAGPGKTENELRMALAAGITLNIESKRELERIIRLTQEYGYSAQVAVRVNPNFELKASGMKMGGGAQQFGIDAEQVPEIVAAIRSHGLNFQGFHIFTGSQNLKVEAICEAHKNIYRLASELKHQTQTPISRLNIGGGLGIPYFPGEAPIELEPIADNLRQLQQDYRADFEQTEIVLELGRYLVGNAGVFISEVIDIKCSRGETFVVVNGGLHHHLAASGNFGQVIRKNYPVAVANKIDLAPTRTVSIVGPLCTPLDLLGHKVELPDIEVGDLIVIYQSGAYGFTASPKEFLSHPAPMEVLV
jgi:diaminopimelate decarboxylase